MPELDGSIGLRAQAPQVNPLEMASQAGQLANVVNQNKLFGQQNRARVAVGRAYSAATDPATGQLDSNKLLGLVSQDPDASFMAGDVAAEAQARQKEQLGIDTTKLDLALKQTQNLRGRLGALLADPSTNADSVHKLTVDLIGEGVLTPQQAMTEISSMPTDPAQLKQWLTNHFVSALNNEAQLTALFPAPTPIDTGGKINLVQTPQLGGSPQVVGSLDKSLSPEAASAPTGPVMVRNADGTITPSTVTRSQYADMAAQGPVATAPALTPGGLTPSEANELVTVTDSSGQQHLVPKASLLGGASGSVSAGGGNGRYPGAGANVGLPPGQAETLAASAKVYQDDLAAVPTLRQTMTTFDQARAALANAPTGVGSDKLQALRGLAETYGIPLPQGIKDDAVAYAETNKWLSSALTQEAGRLGLNTDQARALQAEAQPSAHTVHDAAVQMLPILQGLKAMQLAAPVLAQAQGVTPQQYSAWRANWANSVDPLAFSASQYTQAQRAAMAKNMTAAQKTRYVNGLKAAVEAGIFSREDLAR